MLLVNLLPILTANRAYRGRELVAKAFTSYFVEGHWTQGSGLVQASRYANCLRSLSNEDQARFELTTCIGLLVNTVPAVLWMLFHILTDSELLRKLRAELSAAEPFESSGNERKCTESSLPITTLENSCPLLKSTLQEVLRCYSTSLSARFVTKDTILGGKYLLKAGSLLQIPAAVLHKDPRSWGPKATTFDAARFCPSADDIHSPPRLSAASRAFGGGSTLCPGRRFAMSEIMIFVSMFILQFDAKPTDGSWMVPMPHSANMTNSVMPPPKGMRVKITRRDGAKTLK